MPSICAMVCSTVAKAFHVRQGPLVLHNFCTQKNAWEGSKFQSMLFFDVMYRRDNESYEYNYGINFDTLLV